MSSSSSSDDEKPLESEGPTAPAPVVPTPGINPRKIKAKGQLVPVPLDDPVDRGRRELFKLRNGVWHLHIPKSKEKQIVAQARETSVVRVCCKSPNYGIIMGSTPDYTVDWNANSKVAQVCTRQEIEKFMAGLEEEMKPVCEQLVRMRYCLFCFLCCCCLSLAIIGCFIYACIVKCIVESKAQEIDKIVEEYCNKHREPFYKKGVRPRPGSTGCYVNFVANYL